MKGFRRGLDVFLFQERVYFTDPSKNISFIADPSAHSGA